MTKEPIGVIGAGWVGLVTAACFADLGHDVVVRDIVPERVTDLRAGHVPIHEPGLPALLAQARDRLSFTLEMADLFAAARVVFVCVGTPPTYSGDADLSAVWHVLDELPEVDERTLLVMKSTVPVGTGEKVRAALDARGLRYVGYASNPEFLAEGTAVRDFQAPDRIVIGAFVESDADRVAALYAPIEAPIVRVDVASAEMIKLASNAFLATRISFINEIANVCEVTGADVEQVARGMGLDHRLGPHFLRAGIGFGGSCLAGREAVFVRSHEETRLMSLQSLFELVAGDMSEDGLAVAWPDGIEVVAWEPGADSARFLPVRAVTRRRFSGEILRVEPGGRRGVSCTPDHPFVTLLAHGEAITKLASELAVGDQVPMAPVGLLKAERYRRSPGIGRPGAIGVLPSRKLTVTWSRVAKIERKHYDGWVYSLEVPGAETFVTTGGLVVHNCFPKDVQALKQLAGNSGYHFQLLNAVIEVNELQKRRVVGKLAKHLGELRGKTIALLGLSFKPNTNDMREASSLVLAARLLAEGATVRGWDPVSLGEAHALMQGVELCETVLAAVTGADAAVVVTEWPELRGLASAEVRAAMRNPLIVDGRNLLDPEGARAAGFTYEGIGRAGNAVSGVVEAAEREPAP